MVEKPRRTVAANSRLYESIFECCQCASSTKRGGRESGQLHQQRREHVAQSSGFGGARSAYSKTNERSDFRRGMGSSDAHDFFSSLSSGFPSIARRVEARVSEGEQI